MRKFPLVRWVQFVPAVLLATYAFGQVSYDSAAIYIAEGGGEMHLTVPVSRLDLHLPRRGLTHQPVGSETPRYFLFADESRMLFVSGWFESAAKFKGAKELWEEEMATRPTDLPVPQNVILDDTGVWQTVSFDLTEGEREIAHLKAHRVQSGTWIELHLSAQDNRPLTDRHAFLLGFLSSVRVTEKFRISNVNQISLPTPGLSWTVRLELPVTKAVYRYDMSDPGSPGHGVAGAMFLARVGSGTVSLISHPRFPHKDCNAAIFGQIFSLASEKKLDPSSVRFSKHSRYSIHVYPRIDVPLKFWDAVYAVDEQCFSLSISMPKQTADNDPVVIGIIESLNIEK